MAWWMAIPAVLQAGGTILGGMAENKAAKLEAAQLRQQAAGERAEASRAAAEIARQTKLLESRAIAVGAASGGSNQDASFINALGDIKAAGEYNALSALYEGETAARTLNFGAKVRRWEGRAAQRASLLGAAGKFGESMYSKYGGGGPSGDDPTLNNPYAGSDGSFDTSAYLSKYGARGSAGRR